MTEQLSQKDYELINSYLDQELERKDVVKFAQRMADDPLVRTEVEELMKVKSMIRELPTVTPPRNYILTRAMAEEARPKPWWERLFPVFRTAAAFCALALVFTFVGMKWLTRRENGAERYRNVWPKGLDLEDAAYRPLLRGLSLVGAVIARTVETIGAMLVYGAVDLIFLGAERVVRPPEDENFSGYVDTPERSLVERSFSKDLLCAALGVLALVALILFNLF